MNKRNKYECILDNALSTLSIDELKGSFSELVGTMFFSDLIKYEEALAVIEQFSDNTKPMLVYRIDNQYVIVFP